MFGHYDVRELTGSKLTYENLVYTSKRINNTVGRFIIDVFNSKVYAIPSNIDHPDFVARLVGKSVDELKNNPENFSYFVSLSVGVTEGVIEFSLIGLAGFEVVMADAQKKRMHPKLLRRLIAGKIHYHSKDQLNKAAELTRGFIYDSEISFARDYSENIAWKV